MKYSMKEIAKLANVSQPTVSRVINGNPNVNPDVKKKVLQVIESVGYQPNKAAQTLKNQNSFIIGVSVTSISNPYFMDVIEAIEREARIVGYNILIHNCDNNVLIEKENIKNFISRQVDGIIISPESHENLDILSKMKIPTVVITQNSEQYNSVTISHEKGGALAANDFIQHGIQNFLYVGQGYYEKDLKLKGYINELHMNGFDFNTLNYIHHKDEKNASIELEKVIESYIKDNLNIFNNKSGKPIAGILCGNDIIAIQFISIAKKFNLSPDRDYYIIGFDDTLLARSYRFSSIRQPISDMSINAIKLLLKLLDNSITSINSITLDPILIKRMH